MTAPEEKTPLRAIEFFCGIGGWAASQIPAAQCDNKAHFDVLCAIDINDDANEVYKHNFRLSPTRKSIETLSTKNVDALRADVWMMSPPCQPFTRNNQTESRDAADPRTNAFLSILKLIRTVRFPPRYIALENVVGFEESQCCKDLLDTLKLEGFSYMQFILTPTSFGMPNERPRYYLIAVRNGVFEGHQANSDAIFHNIPTMAPIAAPQISEFLDEVTDERGFESLLVPKSLLEKSASWCLDIVRGRDRTTSCFTKSYGRYIKGTGSVLLMDAQKAPSSGCANATGPDNATSSMENMKQAAAEASPGMGCQGDGDGHDRASCTDKEGVNESRTPNASQSISADLRGDPSTRVFDVNWQSILEGNALRYFSPTELLRVFGFPVECGYSFPPAIAANPRKCYALIGNSLNVTVVKYLLEYMFVNAQFNDDEPEQKDS
jgi:tRNA (cytosine38-C5)-methyltransferase